MLELKFIKLCDPNKYLTCQFMHKIRLALEPYSFNDYFTCNDTVHCYNTHVNEVSMYLRLQMIMITDITVEWLFAVDKDNTSECHF